MERTDSGRLLVDMGDIKRILADDMERERRAESHFHRLEGAICRSRPWSVKDDIFPRFDERLLSWTERLHSLRDAYWAHRSEARADPNWLERKQERWLAAFWAAHE